MSCIFSFNPHNAIVRHVREGIVAYYTFRMPRDFIIALTTHFCIIKEFAIGRTSYLLSNLSNFINNFINNETY